MILKRTRWMEYVAIIILMLLVAGYLRENPEIKEETVKEEVLEEDTKIEVALIAGDGFAVASENPVRIDRGGTAVFAVEMKGNYYFKEAEGVEYKDGRLYFSDIATSRNLYFSFEPYYTISVADTKNGSVELFCKDKPPKGTKAKLRIVPEEHYEIASITLNGEKYPPIAGEIFEFTVEEDCEIEVEFVGEPVTLMSMSNNLGKVLVENQSDEYHYGDELRFRYELPEGIYFNGWSKDGYIQDGGVLISEEEVLECRLTEDTILYANFKDENTHYLLFDGNGGECPTDFYMECSPKTYVNLPVDQGEISREGYTLIGFNTEADGSGETYCLGEMLLMPERNMTLYAEWKKHTDKESFAYSVWNEKAIIKGLTESGKQLTELCIPPYIDGNPVKIISEKAFENADFLEKVYLSTGVEEIGARAFAECDRLTTVYLPETLKELSENAFAGSKEFSNLRVLASLNRVYDYDYDSVLADKYMRLKYTEGKRMILVGGSSLTFGLDSAMLDERFQEYEIINFSGSYLYGMITLMELLEANVRAGDVVIFCPEYYGLMYGAFEATSIANWQYLESNYGMLKDVDIRNTPVMLSRYATYLNRKAALLPGKLKNADSVYVRSGINEYGDLTVVRTNKVKESRIIPDTGIITKAGMERYNTLCSKLTEKGAICLFSFPPTPGTEDSRDYLKQCSETFTKILQKYLKSEYCTIISQGIDYTFDVNLFYDNGYHLTLEGAKKRTEVLIKDLEAFGLE